MQLRPEQLDKHLQGELAPIYLIAGDELLLVQEAADAVRAAARRRDYTSREVLTVERGFDWAALQEAAGSLSLFAERRVLELRLPGGKPGDAGARALREYAADPPPDTVLLVICGKLEQSARRSKWVQTLASAGVYIQVWPVDANRLPAWIRSRMQRLSLRPTEEAVSLLAEQTEGNLLACAQEIEKLGLLHGSGPIDARLIANSVGDSARYGVFLLIDSALEGSGRRCQRILKGLREEGVEMPAVLGALSWELRKLAEMAREEARGQPVGQVLTRSRVWDSRKTIVGRALERHRLRSWQIFLARCARLDRMAKGRADGNVWDELLQLLFRIAGIRLPLTD